MSPRTKQLPRHVAIIMDGNGRWAQMRHLPRTLGHREGVLRVKEIVQAASEIGIEVVTLFAFSTENWSRPALEVSTLMRLLQVYLGREISALSRRNIKVRFIGRRDQLPRSVIRTIERAEEKTKGNTGLTLVLAVNYGSRQEILDGVRAMMSDCARGALAPGEVTEKTFGSYLYTAGLPDPDLLIRTSGEQRISNFMLWQLSYAELYFPEKYWPDFRKQDFLEAIEVYGKRCRRFGGIGKKA
ncbi:MAG TPA: isoprenyl transferase [Candidatus Omnitrophota bacterium]|nr:isoprenyl transferase [Candidatus Omnitrophota bacterium]